MKFSSSKPYPAVERGAFTMAERIFVGTRKGLFVLGRTSAAWQIQKIKFLGDPVTAVAEHDGRIHVALNLGHFGVKMWRADGDAENWQEQPAPTYPEKPANDPDETPWSTELIWTVESGGTAERLWAGTIPGGLFPSDDNGDSWSLVRSLWEDPTRTEWFGGGYDYPGIHSICIHPHDPNILLVGVSCGGAWYSEDGGDSWQTRSKGMTAAYQPPERAAIPHIQDPHRIVRCRENPDVFWCQHHDIDYRSDDGGREWVALDAAKPSVFGFAVAAHPSDPETAWFVPAVKDECRVPVDGKLVVSRTRDGGRTYDVLTEELPTESAYDLVHRHGLDVDGTGEQLVFGSTTGGLWTSDNGGDRWAPLPARLPPIHCVRFGL